MKRNPYLLLTLALLAVALPLASEEDRLPEVETAERIGQLIYEKDRAAWVATDVLMAEGDDGENARLLGWVTSRDDSGWLVTFLGGQSDNPCALFEVPVTEGVGELKRFEECQPLEEGLRSMFRARQAALSAMSEPCTANYNTVVVPAEIVDERGWLVYLLAATTVPGEIVVGGHYRAWVSPDGRTVDNLEPLSKSCLTLEAPAEGDPVAVAVSHVISDTPTEIHVFLSLSHEQPIYVLTEHAMWSAEKGSIRLLLDGEDFQAYMQRAKDQAGSVKK